jgi:periplasmic divalent cation tolerance protein
MDYSKIPVSEDHFCLVMTSVGEDQQARQIARALLQDKLAACIQIMPVESHYLWKEDIQQDKEYLLLIKARKSDWPAIEALIRRNHSYEIAEILQLDIAAGHAPYLDWMQHVTHRQS